MKDLDTEPLLVQEPLESDHCEVLVGSHIGVLVQLPAALLGRLPVEVLMKLLCELHGGLAHDGSMQVRGGLALADLRSILEGRVHTGMPVVGSVEDPGLLEGLAEVVPEGLVGLVHEDLVELVPAGLVEVVPAGLVLVGSVGDSGLPESFLAPGSLSPS